MSLLGDAFEADIRRIVSEAVRDALAGTRSSEADCLLTLKQAAQAAGVSISTIRQWLSQGLLTRRGEGRVVRVLRSEVLAIRPAPSKEPARVTALKLLGEDE